ncbi:TIGR01620 family protein [Pseudoalteromonas fenneropenaei]|uniref:TIGR01620 family protein n=1 Tax=Pseudoalteromonas fenneropenaei TaxID=1737459 RepID=A0ABV7CIK8_9GAMM
MTKYAEPVTVARRIQTHNEDIFKPQEAQTEAKVVAQEDEWTPAPELESVEISQLNEVFTVKKRRRWLTIWLWLAGIAIVIETGLGIVASWQSSFIMGALYSLLALIAVGGIGRFMYAELRALVRLKNLTDTRLQASRLLHSEQVGEAMQWLEPQLRHLPANQTQALLQAIQSHHTDKEVLELYDKQVLTGLDEQAQRLISQYASGSALLVALSPMALLDMLAVLWRGGKMIEAISAVYGVRLGYRSRLKLYKMLLTHMVFVGGTELVTDLAATSLGAELLGKLSARAAQGLSAGIFTSRLGIKTMELCRPLPELGRKPALLKTTVKQVWGVLRDKSPAAKEQA